MLMAETKARYKDSGQARGEREGACPQTALGTPLACPWPLPETHLGDEWDVSMCSLSWLLVPCSEHGKRWSQLTQGQVFWS